MARDPSPRHGRGRADGGAERKAGRRSERKADAKADKVAQGRDTVRAKAQKVRQQADRMDEVADRLDALQVWLRNEPGTRRPRWSRDEIAAAALRIADAEGLDAVSMRRLAVELGAGTMTLYHYVKTKDELLALLFDAVMGEVVVPADQQLPEDWREALRLIARRSRDSVLRHPWVFDVNDDPALGPNAVRHFDQSLWAVRELGRDLRTKLDVISAVDEYVFGHCLQRRNEVGGHDDADLMFGYVTNLVATGDYPALRALLVDRTPESVWEDVQAHSADADRFDRNLDRLLDGIAADLGL